jgi:L-ascorbate metabolism protein UlaG (beta-lactamase superfamily)
MGGENPVVLSGAALVADVDAAAPRPGTLAFWCVGQNGFIFKGDGCVVYIDPYLYSPPEGRRQTPAPLLPAQVTHADVIIGSHDHSDHVDRRSLPAMLAASPRAKLVVSRVVAARLAAEGYPTERLVGMDHGETITLGRAELTAIRAAHEFFDRDPELGYPHLGVGLRLHGGSHLLAGGGGRWEGLGGAVALHAPDGVFVPINGRDGERYRRRCIGNFTFQEAVDLVGALRPRLAVPMHYDMFPGNTERVERFVDYLTAKYPGIDYWAGRAGEQVLLTAR